MVLVSIHAGFFAKPYLDSKYNFQSPEGDDILDLLKAPIGFPSAVVNRKLFDGENDLQLGLADWAGYIAQELGQEPDIKIFVQQPTFELLSRKLTAQVSLFPQTDLSGQDIRLSLMLTENKLVDVQLTPSGKEPGYQHQHVLRTMLTNPDGNLLTEDLEAGAQNCKSFEITLDPTWLVENCDLIAFVHRGGDQKDVLQAIKVPLF